MRNKLLLFFVFCLILKPSISYSLVEIDITRGNLDPLPISVSPFFADEISKEKIKKNLNIDNLGEVKKKTDGVTQSEDKSMKLSKLSVTTEYAVRHQIYTCWSVPTGLPYSEDLLVTVKLNLEKNGIVKNFEMLDHVRMNTPGEGAFYQIAQSVIRAIRLCNPIKNLPTTSYEKWKTMILRFNPIEMMGG